jgi:phosphatidylcholine synthase
MAVAVVQGDAAGFRAAFAWMIVAAAIDASDGFLARKVGVKQMLPGFDGRRLDDITDFLTYTFLPLLLLWRAAVLPPGQEGWLLLPLLASAYGFSQADIKTADGFFLGFPSLWNVVAFYLYVLGLPSGVNLAVLLVLSVLTFVPTRYLYPSQPGRLNRLCRILGCVWLLSLVPVVAGLDPLDVGRHESEPAAQPVRLLAYATLLYPLYYLGASFWVTLRLGRRGFGHTSHAA